MNDKTFEQFSQQFVDAIEPGRAFAGLTASHAEKVVELQAEAMRAYVGMGIDQAREALTVGDPKTFQEYLGKQPQVMESVGRRVQDDARRAGELGQAYAEQAEQLVEDNLSRVQDVARRTASVSA